MLSNYIDLAINYLNTHANFLESYFSIIVFFIVLLESTPIVGTFMPGTFLMLFLGFTAAKLSINLPFMIFAAVIASVLGETFAYFLGKYGTEFLVEHKKILKHSHIEEGRKFFSKHGVKSIFLARFVGPIRPIVPLIAGSVGMNISKFTYYNILSAFVWAAIYLSLGYYFGDHLKQIEAILSDLSMFLILIIIIFMAIYYFKFIKNKKHESR